MMRAANQARDAARLQPVARRAHRDMATVTRHAIPFGGEAYDQVRVYGFDGQRLVLGFYRRDAIAAGTWVINSSATNAGPARRAASP